MRTILILAILGLMNACGDGIEPEVESPNEIVMEGSGVDKVMCVAQKDVDALNHSKTDEVVICDE